MMELNVTLEFACCECEQDVTVKVQCQGEALTQGGNAVLAAVNVPCPTCGQINKLVFDPCGEVRSVKACPSIRTFAEPSLN
jgi:hypothetical protein